MIPVAEAARREIPLDRVEPRRQVVFRLGVQLDAEQRLGIAVDERPLHLLERRALPGMAEDEPVHHLDRRRPMGQNYRRRLERLEQVGKLNREDGLESRQRHQRQLRLEDDAERALGPDHQLGHVERRGAVRAARRDQRIQVVAANPAKHFRIAAVDLFDVLSHQAPHLAITGAFQRIARAQFVDLVRFQRSKVRQRSIRQDDVLFEDVIDSLPVQHRSRTSRIVRHHAADGGAARRRDIRREAEVLRTQRGVQFVEHDTGLDPSPPLGRIHFEDAIEVLRRVDDDAAADGLAGLRRAPAPHRQRAAMLRANRHRPHDVVARFRHHDAERLESGRRSRRSNRARARSGRIGLRRRWPTRDRAGARR